jgi:hypothetical protein
MAQKKPTSHSLTPTLSRWEREQEDSLSFQERAGVR